MAYKIEIDPQAQDQIRALPSGMPQAFAEVITLLELAPWSGAPYVDTKPDGNIRQLAFGTGGVAMVASKTSDEWTSSSWCGSPEPGPLPDKVERVSLWV